MQCFFATIIFSMVIMLPTVTVASSGNCRILEFQDHVEAVCNGESGLDVTSLTSSVAAQPRKIVRPPEMVKPSGTATEPGIKDESGASNGATQQQDKPPVPAILHRGRRPSQAEKDAAWSERMKLLSPP